MHSCVLSCSLYYSIQCIYPELIYLEDVDLMELNLPMLICACRPRFQRTKVYPVEMVQISGTV